MGTDAAQGPTLVLRMLSPHQAAVLESVEAHLAEQHGLPIKAELTGDRVVFRGACTEASLRRRVGAALVGVLGPRGWYDYFRPTRE